MGEKLTSAKRDRQKRREPPLAPVLRHFFPFFRSVFASYELSCSPPSESLEQATRFGNTITRHVYIYIIICIDNDCILFPRKRIFLLFVSCHNRLPQVEPHYPKDPPSRPLQQPYSASKGFSPAELLVFTKLIALLVSSIVGLFYTLPPHIKQTKQVMRTTS